MNRASFLVSRCIVTRLSPARLGAVALVLLLGCGKERTDPRLAEVTTPLHATVRVIDVPIEKRCDGTTFEQLKCMVSPSARRGCIYIEVGAGADVPELTRVPDAERCSEINSATRRVLRVLPGKQAKLYVEQPRAERVVIVLADSVHAVYLRKGQLVIAHKLGDFAPGASGLELGNEKLKWERVPSLLAVLDATQLDALSEAELDALIAETPSGKNVLKGALVAISSGSTDLGGAWMRAFSKLGPEDQKDLRSQLVIAVKEGDEGPLRWFLAHPQEQQQDFIQALGDAAEYDSVLYPTALPLLLTLNAARAESIACDRLAMIWHQRMLSPYDDGRYKPSPAALTVLASRRSTCPWVLPTLERFACELELRCDPEEEEKHPEKSPEVEDLGSHRVLPLCTPKQTQVILEERLAAEPLSEDPDSLFTDWGPLLIAAARMQGPLPASFVRSEERRHYAQHYATKKDDGTDNCRHMTFDPSSWACQLPMAVTKASTEGCSMMIDDTKKTMTLSSFEPGP